MNICVRCEVNYEENRKRLKALVQGFLVLTVILIVILIVIDIIQQKRAVRRCIFRGAMSIIGWFGGHSAPVQWLGGGRRRNQINHR